MSARSIPSGTAGDASAGAGPSSIPSMSRGGSLEAPRSRAARDSQEGRRRHSVLLYFLYFSGRK